TASSDPASSRSAPISPIPPRFGSTATSGPSARPDGPGFPSPSLPTGSPPPIDPTASRPSATGSGLLTSRPSLTGGPTASPPRSPPPTGTPATGGTFHAPGRGV